MENQEELTAIIAENITYYRKKALLTQAELAEKLNYSDKSISKWERGDGTPDVFVLQELAKLFGLTVNDFLVKTKKEKLGKFLVSKVLITIIFVSLVWFCAIMTFFLLGILNPNLKDVWPTWFCFIYAIPASFLVLTITNTIYFNKFYTLIPLSGLLWSTALSLHLSFLDKEGIGGIYVVCIPIQVVLILSYLVIFWFKHKKTK